MTVEPQMTLQEYVATRWEDMRRWQEEVNRRLANLEARVDASDRDWDRLVWWEASVGKVLYLLARGQKLEPHTMEWLAELEAKRTERVAKLQEEQAKRHIGA